MSGEEEKEEEEVVGMRRWVVGTQSQARFTANTHIHAGRSSPAEWANFSQLRHTVNVQWWSEGGGKDQVVHPLPHLGDRNMG